MASKKTTQLTRVTAANNESLFYMVDPTRLAGDQSVGINKVDLKNSLGAETTVISGGMVWVSGLTYESQNLVYSIGGLVFSITDGTQVTLDAAPTTATFQRIDLIYGDDTGNIAISKGTESPTPVANTLAYNQLQLTLVFLDTNGTEPEGVEEQAVYLEDAGEPSEWAATENTGGARIDLASALDPITGTVSIETLSSVNNDDTITFTTSTPVVDVDFQKIDFKIKLKSVWGTNFIAINFYNSTTLVSGYVLFLPADIDRSDTTNVQDISIFRSQLAKYAPELTFNKIEFVFRKIDVANDMEFIIDDFYVNVDTGQTEPVNEFVKIAGDTMTGPLILNADPTENLGAATKQYADNKVDSAGDTMTGDLIVPAEAYGVGWNGSNEVPTKNDLYDKIETVGGGGSGGMVLRQNFDAYTMGTLNLWAAWATNKRAMLSEPPNTSSGTAATPGINGGYMVIPVKGASQCDSINLHVRYITVACDVEFYIKAYDYGNIPGNELNGQVLVAETINFPTATQSKFANFTIAANTLSDESVLYVFFRRTSGSSSAIRGVTLTYNFS